MCRVDPVLPLLTERKGETTNILLWVATNEHYTFVVGYRIVGHLVTL